MKDVESLLKAIELEQIDKNIFRGTSHDIGSPNVYGGQVLSQALNAAIISVPEDRFVHSLHSYFILPGRLDVPIIFQVSTIRDGGSFTTRRVTAIQNGKAIFILAASFQLLQKGFDHQIDMPKVKPPEELQSDYELMMQFKDQLPKRFKNFLRPKPIEFRPVNPLSFILPQNQAPKRHIWMKGIGNMPEDLTIHQRVLAYASDYNLLITALLPHQENANIQNLQLASLDHAMWFHRPFKMDDWILYELDSPSASNTRGFTRGSLYNRNGILIASVVQEGLMREKIKV